MSDDDELGDFEDFGDAPEPSETPNDGEELSYPYGSDRDGLNAYREYVFSRSDLGDEVDTDDLVHRNEPLTRPEENPLDLDPRVGVKDVCYDRAKPGAKVQVVDVLAESVEDYYERFPDAPALDDYAGNVIVRFNPEDPVFACVYLKDSLTSVDTNLTAYPMPESRLTRYPVEEASMVGSSTVEFQRTELPGESHRLGSADPEGVPEDADRDEDGEAVLTEDE